MKLRSLPLFVFAWSAMLAIVSPRFAGAAEATPAPEQLDFFEKKIRPVLADKCYRCHSEKAEKIKGGLVLDTREGIRRGGDSGPAVVPGNLADSILIQAVRYTHKEFSMPPEKAGGKLPAAVVQDLESWVKMGAPDPRLGAAKLVKTFDAEAARKWWAFRPPEKTPVPQPKNAGWANSELDRFILAGLETRKLQPVGDAAAGALFRRVAFDLTGLPPAPKEMGEFLQEWGKAGGNPAAAENARGAQQAVLARWVDKLLAAPQFGERWGRHWLDVARYAESSGHEVNITFPHAWRYRDYVVGAFNADKPFDQFIREQVAGDLLPSKSDAQKAEQMVATGFLALGPKGLNEGNAEQYWLDVADEQIDTVSQAFLGMTFACARCHDHKFDPVSQREYYGLAGIFLSTDTKYGTATGVENRHSSDLLELPAGTAKTLGKPLTAAERARKEASLAAARKTQQDFISNQILSKMKGKGEGEGNALELIRVLTVISQVGAMEAELKSYDANGQEKALAMGVQDLPTDKVSEIGKGIGDFLRKGISLRIGRPGEFLVIDNSPLYTRGDVKKPADRVPRGFPAVIPGGPAIPKKQSGRAQLAEWLVSSENPLTARVAVNRVWLWLFGRGLVESVDNFGTSGKMPTNQALLDHLALRFQSPVARGGFGWSLKRLIREIVLSRTYQLSSDYEPGNFAADPENALLWRASKRRLDAECIRDAMLAASGQLTLEPAAGSFIARSGDSVIGGIPLLSVSEEQVLLSGGALTCRSLYLPVVRDVPPDALALFDFTDPNLVTGARETTNVPAQALYLLNSDAVSKAARALGERVMAAFPAGPTGGATANFDQRLGQAYALALSRPPTVAERAAAWNFFQKFPANWSKGDLSKPSLAKKPEDVKAAWTSFCRALFASADFRFLN